MSKWVGQLGNIHQTRGVAYVDINEDGLALCHLCETGWMNRAARINHFLGGPHQRKYNWIRTQEIIIQGKECVARLDVLKFFESRVNALGLPKWRWHIKALMHDYVANNDAAENATHIEQILVQYEQKERISLLELFIWKSGICDGHAFFSVDEMQSHDKGLQMANNSSNNAHIRRIASGSAIIIPRVMPFLCLDEVPTRSASIQGCCTVSLQKRRGNTAA
eukprot:scaffold73105_cov49-Attheya_sp.AAC.1